MAIYEFICSECSHQDDLIRKMDDSSVTICPQCKKNTFAKQLSAPNFQLSGSGWYATDFKNKPVAKQSNKTNSQTTTNSETTKT
jgi:putative FmdB family regulatory protein|tara:strand:+ start:312 stop:563 length:252 start_codon:yes stop_codon:yes gene_type:complete